MPSFLPILLAGAIWTGTNSPPADMPPEAILREIPTTAKQAVVADDYMVSSAHPLASAAGVKILAAGGNAVDAALAVQAMLSVVEPESSGPGGGCFIMFHDTPGDSLYAVDGREEAPCWFNLEVFRDENGGMVDDPMTGGAPVGIPGTIAAWSLLHGQFGRLPLEQVLAPAIETAEAGFPVSPDMARGLRSEYDRLARFEASRALFFHEDGRPYEEGEIFRNPDLAGTYRLWAEDPGGEFFYRKPIGRVMAATVGSNSFRKGMLRISDLANYRAVYREPIVGDYRGTKLAVMPPPTSGGITLLEILELLETLPPLEGPLSDEDVLVKHLDRLVRASRIAYADRDVWLGDPDWSPDLAMRDLLLPDYIAERAKLAFAADADLNLPAEEGPLRGGNTTHFSVVDADGSMVSCTSTIETIFGSAVVVPGYGFPLNNELTDFYLDNLRPTRVNDITRGRMARVGSLQHPKTQGGKRPRSSMCPVIVYGEKGDPAIALGSPGGSRIIGTVASVLLCLLDHDMGLQEALDFPRLHCRNRPIEIETFGWRREALAAELRKLGWDIAPLNRFPLLQGDVNAVRILPDGRREGAADPRHDGGALGG